VLILIAVFSFLYLLMLPDPFRRRVVYRPLARPELPAVGAPAQPQHLPPDMPLYTLIKISLLRHKALSFNAGCQ
jgi:hypothetical protein